MASLLQRDWHGCIRRIKCRGEILGLQVVPSLGGNGFLTFPLSSPLCCVSQSGLVRKCEAGGCRYGAFRCHRTSSDTWSQAASGCVTQDLQLSVWMNRGRRAEGVCKVTHRLMTEDTHYRGLCLQWHLTLLCIASKWNRWIDSNLKHFKVHWLHTWRSSAGLPGEPWTHWSRSLLMCWLSVPGVVLIASLLPSYVSQ